jgi:cytochrome c oxidase subunit 3
MTGARVVSPYAAAPAGPDRAGPYPIGLLGVLVTVAMLFSAFTAALLVRRTGADWAPISWPPLVWANTGVLFASSWALERSRAAARGSARRAIGDWLAVAALLGMLFLVGQLLLWRALAARGVFLASGPHAAFVYLLSAVHGAHVLGGIGALAWTYGRARAGAYGETDYEGLTHTAIYWHFVGVVWLWLFVLLSAL